MRNKSIFLLLLTSIALTIGVAHAQDVETTKPSGVSKTIVTDSQHFAPECVAVCTFETSIVYVYAAQEPRFDVVSPVTVSGYIASPDVSAVRWREYRSNYSNHVPSGTNCYTIMKPDKQNAVAVSCRYLYGNSKVNLCESSKV